MKTYKRILLMIVAALWVIMVVLGIVFSMLSAGVNMNPPADVEKFYSPVSVSGMTDIAVDSSDNIYIGSPDDSRVQVFNDSGQFLYGLNLPTGTGFFFMAVSDDKLYVYLVRADKEVTIDNGTVVNTVSGYYSSPDDFDSYFNTNSQNNARIWFNKVKISDNNGNLVKTVTLPVSVYPFSIDTVMPLLLMGVVIFFIVTVWKFLKRKRNPLR